MQELLTSDIEVAAVVTNPDRPAGRKLEVQAPPVKRAALDAGLEVLQPEKARDPEFQQRLRELGPDVASVVAYGKILPAEVLDIPPSGFVNLHFSLLPAYRGAAPVQRALMDGVDKTGASVMVLTEGMDEGPLLGSAAVDVLDDDTSGSLGARLAEIGAPLLVERLKMYVDGSIEPQEQDHDSATYAPKISGEEARIDWTRPAQAIRNQIRGLNPAPGAWTTLRGNRVKVLRAESYEPRNPYEIFDGSERIDALQGNRRAASGSPGQIVDGSKLMVKTGEGALLLTEVQPAGKRAMTGAELARGLRPASGESFE